MQFVVVAHDGKNMLEKRMSVRPGHLENIARMKAKGQVVIAGGILDDEGKMAGSVLVLDFENRDQLDECRMRRSVTRSPAVPLSGGGPTAVTGILL